MYFFLLIRQLLNKTPFEQAISIFNLEISTSPLMQKKGSKMDANGNISKVWLNETRATSTVFSVQNKIKTKTQVFRLCLQLLLPLGSRNNPKY